MYINIKNIVHNKFYHILWIYAEILETNRDGKLSRRIVAVVEFNAGIT